MGYQIKSYCYIISSEDTDLFTDKNDVFTYPYVNEVWEDAVVSFFENKIFVSEKSIFVNGKQKHIGLLFYPRRKKTYIVDYDNVDDFIKHYFPNITVITRSPKLYAFLLPLPKIDYYQENSRMSSEDDYNIALGKFKERTYDHINPYIIHLNILKTFDFRESEFDPIFQRDFQNIIDLCIQYKEYIANFLNIENQNNIKITNLIAPFYQLNSDEIIKINEIESEILNDIYDAWERSDQLRNAEYNEKMWDSQLDELYWEAFENNPDNLWNID